MSKSMDDAKIIYTLRLFILQCVVTIIDLLSLNITVIQML